VKPVTDGPERPVSYDDPYAVSEVPVDNGCLFRMVAGVMFVYRDEASLKRNAHIEWPRPDLGTFLTDQELLFQMISDGPL
jgi:AMP deaminase